MVMTYRETWNAVYLEIYQRSRNCDAMLPQLPVGSSIAKDVARWGNMCRRLLRCMEDDRPEDLQISYSTDPDRTDPDNST